MSVWEERERDDVCLWETEGGGERGRLCVRALFLSLHIDVIAPTSCSEAANQRCQHTINKFRDARTATDNAHWATCTVRFSAYTTTINKVNSINMKHRPSWPGAAHSSVSARLRSRCPFPPPPCWGLWGLGVSAALEEASRSGGACGGWGDSGTAPWCRKQGLGNVHHKHYVFISHNSVTNFNQHKSYISFQTAHFVAINLASLLWISQSSQFLLLLLFSMKRTSWHSTLQEAPDHRLSNFVILHTSKHQDTLLLHMALYEQLSSCWSRVIYLGMARKPSPLNFRRLEIQNEFRSLADSVYWLMIVWTLGFLVWLSHHGVSKYH